MRTGLLLQLAGRDSGIVGRDGIDASVRCSTCPAACCRLTVVLGEADAAVPSELATTRDDGLRVMAHREDGYCVALGPDRRCSIYAQRPQVCRRFVMGGAYCRAERELALAALSGGDSG